MSQDIRGLQIREKVRTTNRLNEVLEREGLTQAYIAWKLGVSPSNVSKWVSGSRTPNLKTALEIAKILNTTVDYLWGGGQEEQVVKIDGASYHTMQSVTLSREQAERLHKLIFQEGVITSAD